MNLSSFLIECYFNLKFGLSLLKICYGYFLLLIISYYFNYTYMYIIYYGMFCHNIFILTCRYIGIYDFIILMIVLHYILFFTFNPKRRFIS